MRAFDLKTAAIWCGGTLVQGDPELKVSAVATDTRSLSGGELFVALVGERFDAHNFIEKAADAGVAAAVVSRVPEAFDGGFQLPLILVPDTLVALQRLAKGYRDEIDPLVVGVTGSNGKTSTKDFLRAALGTKFKVHATPGNLNNHIGLPLTLLMTPGDATCVVCELGMSNPGEIAPLAEIASPDIGVITNVGTAHIEFMGSREAIAKEKGALAEAVGRDGAVVLNAEDDFSKEIAGRTSAKVVTAGVGCGDVRADDLTTADNGVCFSLYTSDQSVPVALPVPGRHMAGNAALAAAAALTAGAELGEVGEALSAAEMSGARLQRVKVAGLDILDDSYNANPDSVKAALDTLVSLPCAGKRIAILGRMAELGEEADAGHLRVGREAAESGGVDVLISVGDGSEARLISEAAATAMGGSAMHFGSAEECAGYLAKNATGDDLILIKGSRSSRMEAILEQLSVTAS